MKRIDNKGRQTVIQEKAKKIVTVMSGCLKPYLYFWDANTCTGTDCFKKMFKTLFTVTNGKYIGKNLAFRTYDEAIVLVFATSMPKENA